MKTKLPYILTYNSKIALLAAYIFSHISIGLHTVWCYLYLFVFGIQEWAYCSAPALSTYRPTAGSRLNFGKMCLKWFPRHQEYFYLMEWCSQKNMNIWNIWDCITGGGVLPLHCCLFLPNTPLTLLLLSLLTPALDSGLCWPYLLLILIPLHVIPGHTKCILVFAVSVHIPVQLMA